MKSAFLFLGLLFLVNAQTASAGCSYVQTSTSSSVTKKMIDKKFADLGCTSASSSNEANFTVVSWVHQSSDDSTSYSQAHVLVYAHNGSSLDLVGEYDGIKNVQINNLRTLFSGSQAAEKSAARDAVEKITQIP